MMFGHVKGYNQEYHYSIDMRHWQGIQLAENPNININPILSGNVEETRLTPQLADTAYTHSLVIESTY